MDSELRSVINRINVNVSDNSIGFITNEHKNEIDSFDKIIDTQIYDDDNNYVRNMKIIKRTINDFSLLEDLIKNTRDDIRVINLIKNIYFNGSQDASFLNFRIAQLMTYFNNISNDRDHNVDIVDYLKNNNLIGYLGIIDDDRELIPKQYRYLYHYFYMAYYELFNITNQDVITANKSFERNTEKLEYDFSTLFDKNKIEQISKENARYISIINQKIDKAAQILYKNIRKQYRIDQELALKYQAEFDLEYDNYQNELRKNEEAALLLQENINRELDEYNQQIIDSEAYATKLQEQYDREDAEYIQKMIDNEEYLIELNNMIDQKINEYNYQIIDNEEYAIRLQNEFIREIDEYNRRLKIDEAYANQLQNEDDEEYAHQLQNEDAEAYAEQLSNDEYTNQLSNDESDPYYDSDPYYEPEDEIPKSNIRNTEFWYLNQNNRSLSNKINIENDSFRQSKMDNRNILFNPVEPNTAYNLIDSNSNIPQIRQRPYISYYDPSNGKKIIDNKEYEIVYVDNPKKRMIRNIVLLIFLIIVILIIILFIWLIYKIVQ